MGRRRTIQPAHIIQSALFVLSTRGVESVTISQIAEQAGISEASIYKCFSSKEALLRACVSESVAPQDFWRELARQAGVRPLAELLDEAALFTVRHYEHHLHTLLLRVLHPQSGEGCTGPLQTLQLQVLYFQREIDRGRLRTEDPKRLAVAFCGPLFYYVFATHAILGGEPPVPYDHYGLGWARDFLRANRSAQL